MFNLISTTVRSSFPLYLYIGPISGTLTRQSTILVCSHSAIGKQCPARVQLHLRWPMSRPRSLYHWQDIPHITLGTPRTLWSGQVHQTCRRGEHYILWCKGLLHICSSGPCHLHYQAQVGTGHTTTSQNLHVSTTHHKTVEFCLKNTYFLFQGKYL